MLPLKAVGSEKTPSITISLEIGDLNLIEGYAMELGVKTSKAASVLIRRGMTDVIRERKALARLQHKEEPQEDNNGKK